MIEVTEPQVWVLIAVFAAAMFGLIGIVTSSLNRALRLSFDAVRAEVAGLRETMDARFSALDAKFTGKLDVLDRDVQALSRHVFGADPR